MKSLVIFATVVLVCQAAKVPQEMTHQVIVPVPTNHLAAASPTPTTSSPKDPAKTSISAQVVEVAKDHVHAPKLQAVASMTTMQPEIKTMTTIKAQMITEADPTVAKAKEMKRKTRAVPLTDNKKTQSHSDMNVMKAMSTQKKHTMVNTMPSHRVMRSIKEETSTKEVPVTVTIQPVMVTENPVIKSADSAIDPCDLLCTKFEFEPICATNSLCLHEFPNQCILETYNCKHPSGKFSAIKGERCQMGWLTKCDESEMI